MRLVAIAFVAACSSQHVPGAGPPSISTIQAAAAPRDALISRSRSQTVTITAPGCGHHALRRDVTFTATSSSPTAQLNLDLDEVATITRWRAGSTCELTALGITPY